MAGQQFFLDKSKILAVCQVASTYLSELHPQTPPVFIVVPTHGIILPLALDPTPKEYIYTDFEGFEIFAHILKITIEIDLVITAAFVFNFRMGVRCGICSLTVDHFNYVVP